MKFIVSILTVSHIKLTMIIETVDYISIYRKVVIIWE